MTIKRSLTFLCVTAAMVLFVVSVIQVTSAGGEEPDSLASPDSERPSRKIRLSQMPKLPKYSASTIDGRNTLISNEASKTDKQASARTEQIPIESREEPGAMLADMMVVESRDHGWSSWAETKIAYELSDFDGVDLEVECKETLCELQVEATTLENRDIFIEELPSKIPWESQGFFEFAQENPNHGTVYVLREGEVF